MVNLPNTRPDMVAADFEGVTEALKGKKLNIILILYLFLKDGMFFFNVSYVIFVFSVDTRA